LLKRPDLILKHKFTDEEKELLKEVILELENNHKGNLMKLYMALLYYPAYNKNKEIIATSIVIHDLHDLSRAARTYGVKRFYVVQPMEEQQKVVERILRFWESVGYEYNPNRLEAISVLAVKDSLEDVIKEIEGVEKERPYIIGTSAKRRSNEISFLKTANKIKKGLYRAFGFWNRLGYS